MNYAIGDVQGCFDKLKLLLGKLKFNADCDQLFFLGDVVNRGKQSLKTLHFLYQLKDNVHITLGNHDLHLLACAYTKRQPSKQDTISEILTNKNKHKLLHFLKKQPLIIKKNNNILVHAGICPNWTINQALQYAKLVEHQLQKDDCSDFLSNIYGNYPNQYNDSLPLYDRLRYITNVLTRMRFCKENGELEFHHKGNQNEAPEGFKAWFLYQNQHHHNHNIIFGHWSSLNPQHKKPNHIFPLDTGCVWGGLLSAINLDNGQMTHI